MDFLFKHRAALGFACLALAVIVTFGICFFALSVTASSAQRITVVIDAGHGGVDGGVTGVNTGAKESDINLDISRLLQKRLEEAGLYVVQTRLTQSGLYGAAVSGYKMRDMKKRKEIIENASPALVVSVHQNFFPLSSRRGAQVFYRADSEQSYALACLIQNVFNAMPECARKCQPLAGDYYILNCSEYPSVIAECGFLSNAQDEALLVTAQYRARVAETLAEGILAYLSSAANG